MKVRACMPPVILECTQPEPAPPPPPPPDTFELCIGPAFGVNPTLARITGFEHWYLRHGAIVGGMGPVRETPDSSDVQITDNSWRLSLGTDRCAPVASLYPEYADLDMSCVDRMLQPGRSLGTWGVDGTCQDIIMDIFAACDR